MFGWVVLEEVFGQRGTKLQSSVQFSCSFAAASGASVYFEPTAGSTEVVQAYPKHLIQTCDCAGDLRSATTRNRTDARNSSAQEWLWDPQRRPRYILDSLVLCWPKLVSIAKGERSTHTTVKLIEPVFLQ